MKIDANTKTKTLYKRNYMLYIEKLKYHNQVEFVTR